MIQKSYNQRRGDVLEMQLGRRFVQPLFRERQQPTKGVAIGTDGMGAGLALLHQTLQEKSFEQGRKIGGTYHV
jgi:stalled ribosome alternative rescue factor ArfA